MKNPADDDIIQIGTNVLKNQQKGGTKTGTYTEGKNDMAANTDTYKKRIPPKVQAIANNVYCRGDANRVLSAIKGSIKLCIYQVNNDL